MIVLVGLFAVLPYFAAALTEVALVTFSAAGDITATSLKYAGPSFDLGQIELNRRYGDIINFSLVKIYDPNVTTCNILDTKATFWASRYFYREKKGDPVVGIFGPGCPVAAGSVASLAKVWNKQMLTTIPGDTLAQDKKRYPTLTRMSQFIPLDLNAFVSLVLLNYGYTSVGLLCDKNEDILDLLFRTCESLQDSLKPTYGINSSKKYVDIKAVNGTSLAAAILQEFVATTRVIIIVCHGSRLRPIMLAAYDQGMVDGDYVYFAVTLFESRTFFGNISWSNNDVDGRDQDAKLAYRSLFTISLLLTQSKEYQNFTEKVKNLTDAVYGINDTTAERLNPFSVSYYIALLVYGEILNETIANGGNPYNGTELGRTMWNRTYQILGSSVVLNAKGDRESDWSVGDFNKDTGRFERVLEYYADKRKLVESRMEDARIRKIDWYNRNSPPPNEPRCGYLGNKEQCQQEQKVILAASLSSVVVVVFLCTGVTLFIYRKMKLEAAINDPWWRISQEDLVAAEDATRSQSLSRVSMRSGDLNSRMSSTGQRDQVFAKLAVCKTKTVVVKRMETSRRFHPTRKELKEIRKLRDVNHDNMNHLVAIGIDDHAVQVLFEYCQKGSLADVMENDAIKLDWSFRYSLIADTVTGMAYLHDSPIQSHGHLTSSNCVVDSRFVLKITDYGLGFLQPYLSKSEIETKSEESRLLWRSPENLRASIPPQGTQEGDIFSFAIILQEIILRCEPYGSPGPSRLPMETHAIIAEVIKGSVPPFRPYVPKEACQPELAALMEQAWSEDPEKRPSFKEIRARMKRIPGVETGNLMDNLLKRMEAYATDLEALVMQRTEQVYVEKQKSEQLLYEVLPKSVADRLKQGESVEPEGYDQVSIYFSDIVGFTTLSASSTPMQVVDLLNDLYTLFDGILNSFDVYKVETIGDAYMVASGLPILNGNLHAREIARTSLMLLDGIKKFKIRHRPTEQLRLRIGLHTGPCVAGVVGLKMPRYCLFGETVNIANKMESMGEAMRVHVSDDLKVILDQFGIFDLTLRGEIDMNIKGKMITWWLNGEHPQAETETDTVVAPANAVTDDPAQPSTATEVQPPTATEAPPDNNATDQAIPAT